MIEGHGPQDARLARILKQRRTNHANRSKTKGRDQWPNHRNRSPDRPSEASIAGPIQAAFQSLPRRATPAWIRSLRDRETSRAACRRPVARRRFERSERATARPRQRNSSTPSNHEDAVSQIQRHRQLGPEQARRKRNRPNIDKTSLVVGQANRTRIQRPERSVHGRPTGQHKRAAKPLTIVRPVVRMIPVVRMNVVRFATPRVAPQTAIVLLGVEAGRGAAARCQRRAVFERQAVVAQVRMMPTTAHHQVDCQRACDENSA